MSRLLESVTGGAKFSRGGDDDDTSRDNYNNRRNDDRSYNGNNNRYNNDRNNNDNRRDNNNRNDNRNNNNNNRNTNNRYDNNNGRYDNNNRNNNGNNNRNNNRPYFDAKMSKTFCSRGDSIRRTNPEKLREMLIDGGLEEMLSDLKKWKKDNKPKPEYVINAIYDLSFAGKINKVLNDLENKISSKDLKYLHDELISFIGSIDRVKEQMNKDTYNKDTIEDMKREYFKVLGRANKKRIKKLVDKVDRLSDQDALNIAMFSTGGSLKGVYLIMDYIYNIMVNKEDTYDTMALDVDNFKSLFKACFKKEAFGEVIKQLMLENYKRHHFKRTSQIHVWDTVDKLVYSELESMDTKSIRKSIKEYANERFKSENNYKIGRRFGDRTKIDRELYPKLNKVLDELESDDITIKQFFYKR